MMTRCPALAEPVSVLLRDGMVRAVAAMVR